MPDVAESLAPPERERRPHDPFVGRSRELDSLQGLLEGGRRTPRHALVEGEAGIGKTRLVSEFLDEAARRGVRVLRGACYHVAEVAPYFPFLQILNQLQPANASSVDFIHRLAREVAGRTGAPALSEDMPGKRARLLQALTQAILQDVASQSTAVCVEDVQWADANSLLLLNSLLDQAPTSLCVIATARLEEEIEAASRQLIARIAQRCLRIVLRGLGRFEVAELIARLGGRERLTLDEQEMLREFTKGNPMFVRELLVHLKESGLLERHSLQEAIQLARMPDYLSRLVDLRLCQLPEDALLALRTGALIGRDFSPDLVAQASGAQRSDIDGLLEVGVLRGILDLTAAPELPCYAFSHPVFAKRLHDSTPASLRRRLHSRLARLAESGAASLTVEERARHYALGPGVAAGPRGVDYCREAAEQAEEVLAFETAARFWELALRCARSRDRRRSAEIFRRLGWALWSAGKWERAGEAWKTALGLFEALKERVSAAELALALGDMHRWRQEHAEAEQWLQRALALSLERPVDRCRALALLGSLYCLQGREQGLSMLEQAAAMVKGDGGDPLVTYWLSYGFLVSNQRSKSYAIASGGLKQARRSSDSRASALLAATLCQQELGRLCLGRARSYAQIVRNVADRSDPTAVIRSLACEARLLGYSGRWLEVGQICEQWLATVRLAGAFQVATASFFWAEAQLALGHTEAAVRTMRRVLPDLEPMQHVAGLHLARALVRAGRVEEAAALVRQHSGRLLKSPRFTDAAGRAVLGEVASYLEEPDLWRTCSELLTQESYQLVMAYAPISARRVLGRLAGRLRLWSDAIEQFDRAIEELDRGAAYGELAQCYLDYAELRRRRGRRGDANKAAALEVEAERLYRRLGIGDLRRQAAASDGSRFGLTGRELEVLGLVGTGMRNPEIAEALTISLGTVNRHLENIFTKMGVRARTAAVMLAVQEGLVGPLLARR